MFYLLQDRKLTRFLHIDNIQFNSEAQKPNDMTIVLALDIKIRIQILNRNNDSKKRGVNGNDEIYWYC